MLIVMSFLVYFAKSGKNRMSELHKMQKVEYRTD
jgi:hypothetical protein